MEMRDYYDPAVWYERRWHAAINRWMESAPDRSAAELEELLRDSNNEIPDFAREFLADLVAGKVEPNTGGRPEERSAGYKRAIAYEVYAEQARFKAMPQKDRTGSPRDKAVASVAERRKLKGGTVRVIVEEMTRAGLTFDIWERYIRRTGNRD